MAEMEHVCNEDNGNSWHYDDATKAYYRNFKDGKHEGKILGHLLMNPDFHWDQRKKMIRKFKGELNDFDREKVKPNATSWALWQHWQRKQNAK